MTKNVNGYKIEELLGQGAFGKVHRVTKDDKEYTMKIFTKPNLNNDDFREIVYCKTLSHENLSKIIDVFSYGRKTCYIKKFSEHSLFDVLTKKKKHDKLKIFSQIVNGVACLHRNNIVHGDLKPENILINNGNAIVNDISGVVVNNGFGTTNYVMTTVYYRANELLYNTDSFTSAIDIWSMGCILYELFFHVPLFDLKSKDMEEELKEEIILKIKLKQNNFHHTSTKIQSLLYRMLDINPKTRITAEEILKELNIITIFETKGICSPLDISIYKLTLSQRNFYLSNLIKKKCFKSQHERCFFILTDILDRFLQKDDKKYTNIQMNKLVTVCFFLSTKFFNLTELKLEDCTNLFSTFNSEQSLKAISKKITQTLDYELYNITLYDDMSNKGLNNHMPNIINYLTYNLTPFSAIITEKIINFSF